MASHYAPKTFLRQVRGALLNRCLQRHGIDLDLDIEVIKPAAIEEMFLRLRSLPAEQQQKVENDFATITELACADGAAALAQEAKHRGVDVATTFATARNDYERACWMFLEHPEVFELAACFHEMDRFGASRWTRRFVGRNLPMHTAPDDLWRLQLMMRASYAKDGRGRYCHIDHYQREDPLRHCFFAYPEDHARTDLGYDEGGELLQQARKTAFEVIFVYRPEEGMLDVMAPGGRDRVDDLTGSFCYTILNLPEVPPRVVERSFDLERLKMPDVSFPVSPEDGINLVQLREITLALPKRHGWRRKIVFALNPRDGESLSIHQMILRTLNLSHVPFEDVVVSRARFTMVFSPVEGRRAKRFSFTVASPDHCSLKDGYHDHVARKYIRRWGLVVDGHPAKVYA